jgi:hypothetical protein
VPLQQVDPLLLVEEDLLEQVLLGELREFRNGLSQAVRGAPGADIVDLFPEFLVLGAICLVGLHRLSRQGTRLFDGLALTNGLEHYGLRLCRGERIGVQRHGVLLFRQM